MTHTHTPKVTRPKVECQQTCNNKKQTHKPPIIGSQKHKDKPTHTKHIKRAHTEKTIIWTNATISTNGSVMTPTNKNIWVAQQRAHSGQHTQTLCRKHTLPQTSRYMHHQKDETQPQIFTNTSTHKQKYKSQYKQTNKHNYKTTSHSHKDTNTLMNKKEICPHTHMPRDGFTHKTKHNKWNTIIQTKTQHRNTMPKSRKHDIEAIQTKLLFRHTHTKHEQTHLGPTHNR